MNSGYSMTDDRLGRIETALRIVCAFIRRYAPLLNAHNNDFLTHELWRRLPLSLVQDLERIEDWHEMPRYCISLRDNFLNNLDFKEEYYKSLENDLLPPVDSGCFENQTFSKSMPCAWHSNHSESLKSFLSAAVACYIDCLDVATPISSVLSETSESANSYANDRAFISHAMGDKKSHEIECLSSFISHLCEVYNISRVIDVGSGKGYLGSYLNLSYGIEVLELDSVASNVQGSIKRRDRLEEKWNHLRKRAGYPEEQDSQKSVETKEKMVVSMTAFIENGSHLETIVNKSKLKDTEQRCLLTGLHTCGSLAYSAIDTFINCKSTRVLVNVGCCYNLFDESFFIDQYAKHKTQENSHLFPVSSFLRKDREPLPFSLGRNARIISVQSVDRLAADEEAVHEHMFFRVVLQQLLKEKLGYSSNDWIVGKLGKKNRQIDFVSYTRKALQKLKFSDISDELSDDDIRAYLQQWSTWEKRFHLFYALRCCLGPIVESCILLDRLCHLLENSQDHGGPIREAHLVKVFEARKSPRCFAVFASKDEKSS